MSQTSIRRVQRRPRPPCSSSPFTDCPECLGGRALARCARVRPTGAAAVSALLLLAATSSAFVPSRQVTWSTTGTCITTQLKAISSKKLKVKNFQRQRERMEGSLVQNGEEQPKEAKARDETTSSDTSNTGLDTSKKGGKPVGDPRVSSDAEGQDTDDKHKSLGKSKSDTNDSILKESGVVRLQRAARAELQRRDEKALEDAAAVAAADDEEKEMNAKLSRGRKSNGGANGARRNPNAMGSANAFGNGMAAQSGMAKPAPKTSAINSSWMQKASRGPDEADESKNRPIISLDQLNRNIEKRLNSRDTLWDSRASLPRVEGTVKPPVRDTMSSLLSYNHIKGDWRGHQSASTYNGTSVFIGHVYIYIYIYYIL